MTHKPVRPVPRAIVVRAALAGLFLGASIALSGCDLAYQPNCINNCNGPVGDDAYTRGGI